MHFLVTVLNKLLKYTRKHHASNSEVLDILKYHVTAITNWTSLSNILLCHFSRSLFLVPA